MSNDPAINALMNNTGTGVQDSPSSVASSRHNTSTMEEDLNYLQRAAENGDRDAKNNGIDNIIKQRVHNARNGESEVTHSKPKTTVQKILSVLKKPYAYIPVSTTGAFLLFMILLASTRPKFVMTIKKDIDSEGKIKIIRKLNGKKVAIFSAIFSVILCILLIICVVFIHKRKRRHRTNKNIMDDIKQIATGRA